MLVIFLLDFLEEFHVPVTTKRLQLDTKHMSVGIHAMFRLFKSG